MLHSEVALYLRDIKMKIKNLEVGIQIIILVVGIIAVAYLVGEAFSDIKFVSGVEETTVSDSFIEGLVRDGFLSEENRNDPAAIQQAVEQFNSELENSVNENIPNENV